MAAKKSTKESKGSKAEAKKLKEESIEVKAAETKTAAKAEAKAVKGVRKESAKAAAPQVKARPLPRPVEKSSLELDEETKRLLGARKTNKASHPEFRRIDAHKKDKLAPNWRRPRGHHSQLRRNRKAKGARVKAGYGSPAVINGYHPSGYEEVYVSKPEDVRSVTRLQAIRIAGTVGKKKKIEIEKLAKELNIKVLNPLNTFEEVQ
ncbi:50S ribosomal protein L32e [Methanocella sp. CWC-04]|uniref:Large ribosomal subunit protein eL32 n=1 Tax=Methanooceanicella nereidis TaxID=2052831 RepID=A0AAP2RAU9_9EURY|nr:50S ribosomal protein L32e [Methanocella sp. CWC-04]MCD1293496.1 50S ribosomal protein L32e [Methanocella sp. CWC-04]